MFLKMYKKLMFEDFLSKLKKCIKDKDIDLFFLNLKSFLFIYIIYLN